MSRRYADKRDANESEIITALKEVGAFVIQETNIDLYVLYRDRWYAIEVKGKQGRLTSFQLKLHKKLRDEQDFEVPIVVTVYDALRVIGAIE